MMCWTKALLFPIFFLLIASLVPLPARSQVMHAYDWVKVGAYAKYTSTEAPMRIIFPNGTKVCPESNFWGVFEWIIVNKADTVVQVNVTLFMTGNARIIYPGVNYTWPPEPEPFSYRKTVLIDVDIYTRETVYNGESVGKEALWVEPLATTGENMVMTGKPPNEIVGEVHGVGDREILGYDTKTCNVWVLQLDPFAFTSFVHEWYTGVATWAMLIGPIEILPGSHHAYNFPNGTVYNITRYASTPLGDIFHLEGELRLNIGETNIRLGPPPVEPEDTDPPIIEPHVREPQGNPEPSQTVKVSVKVTDVESGVKYVVLHYTVDDGSTWNVIYMDYNETSGFYEGIISGQPADTWAKYDIIAYDNAENQAEQNNTGQYFAYYVIPEFSSTTILLLVMILATVVAILIKGRFSQNAKSEKSELVAYLVREETSKQLCILVHSLTISKVHQKPFI